MQKFIVRVSMNIHRDHRGLTLQVTHHVYETNLGGGKLVEHVDRYEHMTPTELTDVLEVIASGPTVGDPYLSAEQTQLAL